MSVGIEVGDTFVWQHDHKGAQEGDTILISNIYVDVDGLPQVSILNYRDEKELVTAQDIQAKWEAGYILKEE